MKGHTTMTCPHRVATEFGVVPAPPRNAHNSLEFVFERQLRPRIPKVSLLLSPNYSWMASYITRDLSPPLLIPLVMLNSSISLQSNDLMCTSLNLIADIFCSFIYNCTVAICTLLPPYFVKNMHFGHVGWSTSTQRCLSSFSE